MGTAAMRNVYLVISGVCAVVTVLLGVVQTFSLAPGSSGAQQAASAPTAAAPALSVAPPTVLTVAKSDPQHTSSIEQQQPQVASGLTFTQGTREGIAQRYALADLFDGDPASYIETQAGEPELDFIAELKVPATVTAIEYSHPAAPGTGEDELATTIDLIVLPETEIEGSGRAVQSFTLAPQKGPQHFDLQPSRGKGVWLRIAGKGTAQHIIAGSLKLITRP